MAGQNTANIPTLLFFQGLNAVVNESQLKSVNISEFIILP